MMIRLIQTSNVSFLLMRRAFVYIIDMSEAAFC